MHDPFRDIFQDIERFYKNKSNNPPPSTNLAMDETLITPKSKIAQETGSGEESGCDPNSPQVEKSFAFSVTSLDIKLTPASYFDEGTYNATSNPLTTTLAEKEIAPIIEGKRSPPSFPQYTAIDKANWEESLIHYSYPNPEPDKPDIQCSAAIGPRSRLDDINWKEVERLKEVADVAVIERRAKMKKSSKKSTTKCTKADDDIVEVIDVGDIVAVDEKPDFMQFWKWMF